MPLTYRCGGRERGVCDYESETKWTGPCPNCSRYYAIKVKGSDDNAPQKSSLTALSRKFQENQEKRISTGNKEFDRVIGGGLVEGSTLIISGPPGTGKTSLLLDCCDNVADAGNKVIYASGEQNADDIGKIAARIGIENDNIHVMGMEGDIEKIVDKVDEMGVKLVVIDSLQKAFDDTIEAKVGSVAQGKAVIEHLIYFCKKKKVCAIVVSHVKEDGEMAGGVSVAHDVDTLVEFNPYYAYDEDGEPIEGTQRLRVLSVGKNRNGPSDLSAMFEMTPEGVKSVPPKSKLVLV